MGATRFPNGVNNETAKSIFSSLKTVNPTQYHEYMEDFDYYTAGDWTVTETQAGATQALGDADGGVMILVNSAANNDVNQIKKVGESYLLASGKKLFMRARLKVDDATNANIFAGLQITNTDGAGAVTDGLYFLKPAASTSVSIHARKASVNASAVVATVANDTYLTLEAYYDGVSKVYYGYNNIEVGSITVGSTYLSATELAPILGVKNGTAVARTGTFDYLFVAKER